MRHSYHTEQWLPYPVEQVFAFFSNPRNLPLLMRNWQKARIDTSSIVFASGSGCQHTQAAGSGSRITLSFLPFPFSPMRLRWVAEIVEFKWNERFCDRQISGPFSYWHHCHYLQQLTESGVAGTLVADDLEYEWHSGVIAQFLHRFILRRQIERTFAFRQGRLAQILSRASPSTASQEA